MHIGSRKETGGVVSLKTSVLLKQVADVSIIMFMVNMVVFWCHRYVFRDL